VRRVRYSVAMSLDGYIADPEGGYDWIVIDPAIDFGAMFKTQDTLLMGRKSYDQSKQTDYPLPDKKLYVFSRTLRPADVPKGTLSNDVAGTVRALKKQKGKGIWLWGGGELFRSMLELGLVDEIEVAVIPVLLGDGLPLLPKAATRVSLKLKKQKLYKKTGTVMLNYDVTYRKAR
jgi:dihydrofolate reductase